MVAALLDPSFPNIGRWPVEHDRRREAVIAVVTRSREAPFSIQSDFARQHAEAVGIAASFGYITTLDVNNECRHWMVTRAGMNLLEARQ